MSKIDNKYRLLILSFSSGYCFYPFRRVIDSILLLVIAMTEIKWWLIDRFKYDTILCHFNT